MDYQTISDPAQLQLLEHLLRVVLHGILLMMAAASVCLFGLCVSELRLPRRRPSGVKGREPRASGAPMPEAGWRGPGSTAFSGICHRPETSS